MLQKLKCDKLMGQASRLQTDFDRLSLRNDLGLSKTELEHIAKRMAPPAAKVRALCYQTPTSHACTLFCNNHCGSLQSSLLVLIMLPPHDLHACNRAAVFSKGQ